MHEHATHHGADAPARKPVAPRSEPAGLEAAGNRALGDALSARPVQRWPDLDDLGGLLGGGPSGNPTPDLGGIGQEIGSLTGSLPSLGDLLPTMPKLNVPGVSLNIDTDAGTASGGVDFHNGNAAKANFGAGGLDASGSYGNTSVAGHASSANDWSVSGLNSKSGGTAVSAGFSDSGGRLGGQVAASDGRNTGSLGGAFGGGQASTASGSYFGDYGNLHF